MSESSFQGVSRGVVVAVAVAISAALIWAAPRSTGRTPPAPPAPEPAPPCEGPDGRAWLAALGARWADARPVAADGLSPEAARVAERLERWRSEALPAVLEPTDVPADLVRSAALADLLERAEPLLAEAPDALRRGLLGDGAAADALGAHVAGLLDPARLEAVGRPPALRDPALAEELADLSEVLGDGLDGLCGDPGALPAVLEALADFHVELAELPASWALDPRDRDPWRWAPPSALCACP